MKNVKKERKVNKPTVETNPTVFKKIKTQNEMYGRIDMFMGFLIGEFKDNKFYVNDIAFCSSERSKGRAEVANSEITKLYLELIKKKKKIIGLFHYTGIYHLPFVCCTTSKTFYNLFRHLAILLVYDKNEDWIYYSNYESLNCFISEYDGEILRKENGIFDGKDEEPIYDYDRDYDDDDEEEDE